MIRNAKDDLLRKLAGSYDESELKTRDAPKQKSRSKNYNFQMKSSKFSKSTKCGED